MASTSVFANNQGQDWVRGGQLQAIFLGTAQAVATSGSSAQSAAVGTGTSVVRLCATQDCYVAIGASPTATTSSTLLPAGAIEYFGISGGQKVAALQVTTAGSLSITEGA